MGTRCLTVIKEGDKSSPDLCVIYRQMDGYPDGHGEDIRRLIGNIVVTNGYGDDTTVANGMGCLAAQLVTGLKLDVLKHHEKMCEWRRSSYPNLPDYKAGMAGGIYIYSAGTRGVWEDYTYTIYLIKAEKEQEDDLVDHFSAGDLYLMVESSHGGILYDGLLREFSSEACNSGGD